MSAWVVSKNHIHFLVTQLVRFDIINLKNATKTGRILWKENYKSVQHRYPKDIIDALPGARLGARPETYKFFWVHGLPDMAKVVKNIECYTYQSCEHDGWEKSKANKLMAALEETVLATLKAPWVQLIKLETLMEDDSYQKAPWGID